MGERVSGTTKKALQEQVKVQPDRSKTIASQAPERHWSFVCIFTLSLSHFLLPSTPSLWVA